MDAFTSRANSQQEKKGNLQTTLYKPNVPIAIIEAKDNKHWVKGGIQQVLGYSNTLDIPCVFSSNGDGFYFHDKTATDGQIEKELSLAEDGNVFTTNYDLLLYWVLIRNHLDRIGDGFGREAEETDEWIEPDDREWSELRWGKNTAIPNQCLCAWSTSFI